MTYYPFLPAMLFRFVLGYGFYVARRERFWRTRVWAGVMGATLLLFLYAAVDLYYSGVAQVGYSRLYTHAIRDYSSVRPNAPLTIESYPFYAEQVVNTQRLLGLVFHQDRQVKGISDLVDPGVVTKEMRQLLRVSDADLSQNEANWPKKGDYVLAFTGDLLANWQIRGVAPWFSDGSDLRRDGGYDMELLREQRIYFPAVFLNVWTLRPQARDIYLGYQLYRVAEGPRFTWLGKYPDGWMGKTARLTMYPDHVTRAEVYVSTSLYNPQNSVSVYRDEVLIGRSDLSPGREWALPLIAAAKERPTTFRFEIARTFIPRNIHLSRTDMRQLGARIRIESLGRD